MVGRDARTALSIIGKNVILSQLLSGMLCEWVWIELMHRLCFHRQKSATLLFAITRVDFPDQHFYDFWGPKINRVICSTATSIDEPRCSNQGWSGFCNISKIPSPIKMHTYMQLPFISSNQPDKRFYNFRASKSGNQLFWNACSLSALKLWNGRSGNCASIMKSPI